MDNGKTTAQTIESRLLSLKSSIDTLTQQRDRALWERDNIQQELISKYGLSTAEEALEEADRLEKEAVEMEAQMENAVAEIESKYKDLLAMARG